MYLKSQNIIIDHKQKNLQSFIQTQKPKPKFEILHYNLYRKSLAFPLKCYSTLMQF
jgi:hypothetical protein